LLCLEVTVEKRTQQINVRLRPSELRLVDAAATANDMRRSEWLRRLVSAAIRRMVRTNAGVRADVA